MFIPAAQGFGRVASSLGLNTLGGAPGRDFERELGLGSTSLRGKAAINAAKARGRAIEYAGRQDRNAAIFGGAMSALGSLGSAGIQSGMFGGGGGGVGDYSSVDAQVMGTPTLEADYRGTGKGLYWDTDMGVNQSTPIGYRTF